MSQFPLPARPPSEEQQREEQRGVLPKSILRSANGRTQTELVKEGEEEGMEEEAVSAAAAPLIISSVAGGRA